MSKLKHIRCYFKVGDFGKRFRTQAAAQKYAIQKARRHGEVMTIDRWCFNTRKDEYTGEPRVVSRCGQNSCTKAKKRVRKDEWYRGAPGLRGARKRRRAR